jgi:hypothetical protein
MQDITKTMHEYRECVRGLWNRFLLPNAPRSDFDAVERFQDLSAQLFDELVLRPLAAPFQQRTRSTPYAFLRVQPTSEPAPLMINRTAPRGGYWDEPITGLACSGLSLAFVEYFDWDDFDYIDLQYYRIVIEACDEHPQLIGREALMEVHHARIMFDPEAIARG